MQGGFVLRAIKVASFAERPGKFLGFSRARQQFSVVCGGFISLQRGGFESSPHILRPPLADVTRAAK